MTDAFSVVHDRRRPRRAGPRPLAIAWTALRVATHLSTGLAESVWVPHLTKRRRDVRIQLWARRMLNGLGIEVEVLGAPPAAGPLLLVSNHISWLDILALHAVCHCRFVAKANVRRWPLVGRLATAAGTFYVERESRRDLPRVLQLVANALAAGEIIAVFPEGTSGNGATVLPFHANLIEGAILADAPVQPVAIQFVDSRSADVAGTVSYMGDDSLVASIWRTMCLRGVRVIVTFGTPERAAGRTRRAWAEELRQQITAMCHRR